MNTGLGHTNLNINFTNFSVNNLSNLPSVLLFQKQELAVCKPAPFFCMMTHVTAQYNIQYSIIQYSTIQVQDSTVYEQQQHTTVLSKHTKVN